MIGVLFMGRQLSRREVAALVLSYAGIGLAFAHDLKFAGETRSRADRRRLRLRLVAVLRVSTSPAAPADRRPAPPLYGAGDAGVDRRDGRCISSPRSR